MFDNNEAGYEDNVFDDAETFPLIRYAIRKSVTLENCEEQFFFFFFSPFILS